MIEHLRAIDLQIADVRKLRHRLERDGVAADSSSRSSISAEHDCRTRAVDDHRADAAHLFETVHVPNRRRGLLAFDRDRILANLHQAEMTLRLRR